jgi:imidazolonepropionase-like amidohydrolase
MFLEDEIGSLEPGKYADIAVTSVALITYSFCSKAYGQCCTDGILVLT